jgi:hypothetical protein
MYVSLVVTTCPIPNWEFLRWLRQQMFVAVSLYFQFCCKCKFLTFPRGSLSVWGVLFSSNIQALNTTSRPLVVKILHPQERPNNLTLGRTCWILGCTRVPWHKLPELWSGLFSMSLWGLTRAFCFCFEIVIFTSTDELRVPQFVDLT